MIRYRKENPTLIYGDYQCVMENDPNMYIYERWDDQHRFLIALNMSDHDVTVELPGDGEWDLRIGNYKETNKSNAMRPWEAKIFKQV